MLNLQYNDSFDIKHYPMEERHLIIASQLQQLLNIPDSENVKWYYDATIHGRIITIQIKYDDDDTSARLRFNRLSAEQMQDLVWTDGFRWYEINLLENPIRLSFGVK